MPPTRAEVKTTSGEPVRRSLRAICERRARPSGRLCPRGAARPNSGGASRTTPIPTPAGQNQDRRAGRCGRVGRTGVRIRRSLSQQNRGHTMAMGHALQFSGASIDKYDEVQDALGWHDGTGAPEGLLAHAAGATENGFCVVEWWKAESDWDKFFSERLMPAFEKVGDIPQPQVTRSTCTRRTPRPDYLGGWRRLWFPRLKVSPPRAAGGTGDDLRDRLASPACRHSKPRSSPRSGPAGPTWRRVTGNWRRPESP